MNETNRCPLFNAGEKVARSLCIVVVVVYIYVYVSQLGPIIRTHLRYTWNFGGTLAVIFATHAVDLSYLLLLFTAARRPVHGYVASSPVCAAMQLQVHTAHTESKLMHPVLRTRNIETHQSPLKFIMYFQLFHPRMATQDAIIM